MPSRKSRRRTRTRRTQMKRKSAQQSAEQKNAPASLEGKTPSPATGPLSAFYSPTSAGAVPLALAVLVLCLLIAVSFYPATLAGFVWDDAALKKASPVQSWGGLWQIWFEIDSLKQVEGHYWPLLYTTFWLEHKLWGFAPVGYHIVNLLLHGAVTLLLWRVLLRLGVPGAWFAAAAFAVHPLHVESVVWIIGRKDLLSGLFFLAAVPAYITFVETGRWNRYVLSLALFVLGLLCKSIIVTLPASLLVWHWWKRGCVTAIDLVRTLPFFVLGLGITIADWVLYKGREIIAFDYSLIERALIAARALWFYSGKLVWPNDLAVIHPRWDIRITDPLLWGYALTAIALPILLWFYRNRIGRGPLAAILFFAVTLSPTLGFVDYGYMQFSFVADRYQYLAGIGVIAALVGAAALIIDKLPGVSKLSGMERISGAHKTALQVTPAVLAGVILTVFGALTWQQAGIYRNDDTFFSHIVSLNPQAREAHHNLGHYLYQQDRFEEALDAYRIGLVLKPDSAPIVNKMGVTFEKLNRIEDAEERYRLAMKLDPRDFRVRHNLGLLLTKQQHHKDGVKLFREALKIKPDYADAHIGLGLALLGLDRHEEAKSHYRLALKHDPRSSVAMNNLALILLEQRQFEEAVKLFRDAVGISPGYASAHTGMGLALLRLRRHEEALQSFDQALALDSSQQQARAARDHVRQLLEKTGESNPQ